MNLCKKLYVMGRVEIKEAKGKPGILDGKVGLRKQSLQHKDGNS
jgi:hypothetical protein